MNDDTRLRRDVAPASADPADTDHGLARCKRRSLGSQALRAAWELGALLRRVEREAPDAQRPLRAAVEVLLSLARANEAPPPGSPRQGELF